VTTRRGLMIGMTVALALAAGVAARVWVVSHFAWEFLVGGMAAAMISLWIPGQGRKLLLAAAAAGLALAAAEWLLAWRTPWTRFENEALAGRFRVDHPVLGYTTQPGSAIRHRRYRGDRLLYDSILTIGPDGLRAGAGSDPAAAEAGVLFFGCSYTFGNAVSDADALPFQFERRSAGRFKAYNLALPGYGPHHMLALLEGEQEKSRVAGHQRYHAVYLAITDHLHRVSGRALWDVRGPRYEVTPSGELYLAGSFHGPVGSWLLQALSPSRCFRAVRAWTQGPPDPDVYRAVVTRTAVIVAERYRADMLVLVWPDDNPLNRALRESLEGTGLTVRKVEDAIPDYAVRPETYAVPGDGHPTARAYDRLAEYLLAYYRAGAE
jgi:hypothetical protein